MVATRTRFSSHGPAARRGTVIRFRLRMPGRVELVVRVAGQDGCTVIDRKQTPGHAGLNRVRFVGRVHGHALAVGNYTITVVVVRGSRRTRVGTVAVQVVPPDRRLTPAQRTAPVPTGSCGPAAAAAAGAPPGELLAVGAPLAVARDGGDPPPGSDPLPARGGTSPLHGPAFRPPALRTGGIGGGDTFPWLPLSVYVLLAAIVATALVQITRFFRGTWDP